MYSVIHKRVFTPLRDLPTRIIEAIDHSSNSTIAFAFTKYITKSFVIHYEGFELSHCMFGTGRGKVIKTHPPHPRRVVVKLDFKNPFKLCTGGRRGSFFF